MSIYSAIDQIKCNVAAAYDAAEEKGATMPLEKNSANLADTIASISSGGSGWQQFFDGPAFDAGDWNPACNKPASWRYSAVKKVNVICCSHIPMCAFANTNFLECVTSSCPITHIECQAFCNSKLTCLGFSLECAYCIMNRAFECSCLTGCICFPAVTLPPGYANTAAFNGTSFSEIDLPNWVASATCTSIYTFQNSPNLETVRAPLVCNLVSNMFCNTPSLKCVELGCLINCKTVPNNLFCNSGIEDVSFLSHATCIGNDAFKNTPCLTTVCFPCVSCIGGNAFQCSGSFEAYFPSVTCIGCNAFACSCITCANFPSLTVIPQRAFQCTNCLTTICFPCATTICCNAFCYSGPFEAYFPCVTCIGCYAFFGSCITCANFPLATSIGTNAFVGANCLQTVIFDSMQTVPDSLFSCLPSLTEVCFPCVTCIGRFAFCNSGSFEAYFPCVTCIGTNVFTDSCITCANFPLLTAIQESAFCNTPMLSSVCFPNATCINRCAFKNSGHFNAYFPSVTTVCNEAFFGSGIYNVDLPLATSIGCEAFWGTCCLVSGSFDSLLTIQRMFYQHSCIACLSFSCATCIIDNAFREAVNLQNIAIPVVSSIGDRAFESAGTNCGFSLIATNVETIGELVFEGSGLISANIMNVCSIGAVAFLNTSRLEWVDISSKTVNQIKSMTNFPWGAAHDVIFKGSDGNINAGGEPVEIKPYIKSDGNAYIQLPRRLGNTYLVSMEIYVDPDETQGGWVYGADSGTEGQNQHGIGMMLGNGNLSLRYGNDLDQVVQNNAGKTVWAGSMNDGYYTFYSDYDTEEKIKSYVLFEPSAMWGGTDYNLAIFALNRAGVPVGFNSSAKIYSFTIYDPTSEDPVIDLVPINDPINGAGFHDNVTGNDYFGQGSGTLEYGEDLV